MDGMYRIMSSAALAMIVCAVVSAAPARALPGGDGAAESPGLDGRETHMTVLTTQETDCTEVPIARAVTSAGARALVPDRYEPAVSIAGDLVAGRMQMWDYVCDHLAVDGQRYAPRTQISLGAIALTTRDSVSISRGYYLVYMTTDNPILAARYRQLGLPAVFAPDLFATVSDSTASSFEVSFTDPTPAYTLAAVGQTAPVPVPVDTGGPSIYYQGRSGEVLVSYQNTKLGTALAQVTADYRQHEFLAPIIALPRLLQPVGVPFSVARGDWDATTTRLD